MARSRHRLPHIRVAVGGAFALLFSCSSEEPPRAPSLSLVPAGVIDLEDPDSTSLGMAGGFAQTADGGYYVPDRQRGVLLQFSARGQRVREIGRRGGGPGEWTDGPYGVHAFNDSMLAVSDGSVLKVFPTARPGEGWKRAQTPMAAAIVAESGVVYARHIDRDRRATLSRYRGPSDSMTYGGPFPSQFGKSRMADLMLTFVSAAPVAGDTMAVFTQGSDYLFVGPFAGPYDSLLVPIVTRRGAMVEVMSAVRDDDPDSGMKAAYKSSFPLGVHRLDSAGGIALLTIDQEFLGNRMGGALHLAVVNRASRVACGEVRVPVETDPQPWAFVARDTLFVLSHETDSTAARSQPRVRRFRIDRAGC
jgi:hypothetical protein